MTKKKATKKKTTKKKTTKKKAPAKKRTPVQAAEGEQTELQLQLEASLQEATSGDTPETTEAPETPPTPEVTVEVDPPLAVEIVLRGSVVDRIQKLCGDGEEVYDKIPALIEQGLAAVETNGAAGNLIDETLELELDPDFHEAHDTYLGA